MALLSWIDDKNFLSAVNHLLIIAKKAKEGAEIDFEKNVIDPFSAIFEISGFEMNYLSWKKNETARQAQKTLQNHIGEFHQKILGSVKGWENKTTGNVIDLVSHKHKILAEVKNKYNTISGGKLSETYYSLEKAVMPKMSIYKGYDAYYVAVIPKGKKRYNKEFAPSDKEKGEKCPSNKRIREIDGASFYDLVTGHKNALEGLFDILPKAISICSKGMIEIEDPEKLKIFFSNGFERA
jgi:hypothetical protein